MRTPLPTGIADDRPKVRTQSLNTTPVVGEWIASGGGRRDDNLLDIRHVFKPVRDGRFAATEIAGPARSRRRIAGGRVFYPKGF
jgi:hypothetical protein